MSCVCELCVCELCVCELCVCVLCVCELCVSCVCELCVSCVCVCVVCVCVHVCMCACVHLYACADGKVSPIVPLPFLYPYNRHMYISHLVTSAKHDNQHEDQFGERIYYITCYQGIHTIPPHPSLPLYPSPFLSPFSLPPSLPPSLLCLLIILTLPDS